MYLSPRIASLAESPTLKMSARCSELKAQGVDIISMAVGEPDQDTPDVIRQAAREAIDNHWSHYGPVAGIPALRETIADKQNNLFGNTISWKADDVIVSVGAKMAICNAIQTLVGDDDEVIIPTPSWVSYCEQVKLAGGKVIDVPTRMEDNYCLTPDQLQAAITPRTRLLILCSPNNPTGSVYSRAQLDGLVAVLKDHPQVAVLSDEIYNAIVYDEPALTFAAYPELADRLIIINGVSKAYAMTGYRIGWLLAKNKTFLQAFSRLQGQQITCATMVAQKAAEAALTGSQDCVETMRQTYAERRDLICRLAQEIPGFRFFKPQGAFYLFPDVSTIGTADEVVERILEHAHVAVVSGSAFGCPTCIRLSYAISTEEITEAMKRIKAIFQ